MPQRLKSTIAIPRVLGAGAGFGITLIALGAFVSPAGAAPGWSRSPDSALGGSAIQVASSTSTLCQWLAPAEIPVATTTSTTTPPPGSDASVPSQTPNGPAATGAGATGTAVTGAAIGDPVAYDGVRVELALEAGDRTIPLGDVEVTPGGAWSGSVTIPPPVLAPAGTYDLIARCIVDDPRLDGIRSFDFDPLSLAIVESPPPTTVTIPVELVPPITETRPAVPVEVQGEQRTRPGGANAVANPAPAVPTLPETGDGTLAVALAGVGALMLGGGALWYGGRRTLHQPDVG